MKKLTWQPVAVGAAVLLAGCSSEMINALLAATQAGGKIGNGSTGQISGDRNFGGRWYACGMASKYLELNVDEKGQISGKVVDNSSPNPRERAVRGTVHLDGKATVEFVPMQQGEQALRLEVVGDSLRGINSEAGAPIVLQRTIVPGVTSCAGTEDQGDPSPYGTPDPYRSGYSTPNPYQTHYNSPNPYQTHYNSPTPYESGYYSPTPYESGYYSPTPYESGYYSPTPYESGYYSPTPYESGYYGSHDPYTFMNASPMPYSSVSEGNLTGTWYMCGYGPDYFHIGAANTSSSLLPLSATVDGEQVATGSASLFGDVNGNAMLAVSYDPVPGNHWVAWPGEIQYDVLPGGYLRLSPGFNGPDFFSRGELANAGRCIAPEFNSGSGF